MKKTESVSGENLDIFTPAGWNKIQVVCEYNANRQTW